MHWNKLKKFTAAILAVTVLTGSASAAVVGSNLKKSLLTVAGSARVETGAYYSESAKSKQTEHVLTYEPNDALIPMVAYGDTLYGRSALDYVTSWVQNQGNTVVAALNGSFFDMNTGIPYGLVVTDGILRTSGDLDAVGFRADGSIVLGKPTLQVRAALGGASASVSVHYNKALTKAAGMVLYSGDYDAYTKSTVDSYNVVLTPETDKLSLNGTVSAKVNYTGECESCEIPAGSFVLSMATETDYTYSLGLLKALKKGDTISIQTSTTDDWADVRYACAGGEYLVQNGAAATAFTLDSALRRTGRTAIGLKADGSAVFYTIDGLQSGYSMGLTLAELAARMKELGCVTALNFDGGGSTILSAQYPGYSGTSQLSSPSDGKQRKCANFIFLTMPTRAAQNAQLLHLYPYNAVALPNAQIKITPKASDSAYYAASVPQEITYTAENGEMDGNVLTAGTVGVATVSAVSADGASSGSVAVQVIETPSAISIKSGTAVVNGTTVTVAAGETLDFSAAASFNTFDVYASDHSFTWALSDAAVGTVDEKGLFTAAEIYADKTAELTVSCGARSVKAEIHVTAKHSPFTDLQGHWAEEPVDVLYEKGVLTGSKNPDGALVFKPDNAMTRQEFAVALVRFVGVDTAAYDAVVLPFADADKIDSWAVPAMKAAYGLGYISGSSEGGVLKANPRSTISRQETMTILARTQTLGAARDSLAAFSDADTVAAWALDAVQAMVAQGVISGSNGRLEPTGKVTRAQVAKMLYSLPAAQPEQADQP
ncbi:MAG: phosphodiester glycosidase family protein [Oscillospiraceae bacterium]|nr:phosphodiester glycosidase family protein [Oscillospiraceae bacterium]